ncbi:MAG: DUF4258 domain-containing protein [Desulfovibrio sp.]|nr:DUF4258 domain-containing protein [Desulfovibrio sp.]
MPYMTNHAKMRCQERRIYEDDIWAVLVDGREIRSDARSRTLQRGRLYVVLSNVNNKVVTAYRKMSIKKYLKKKLQRLRKQAKFRF